jgi:prepilin-type N-terminal cleavage/methylation domain-containing protein
MKSKGFTLVELLAVIVILAIILAVAVPSISNAIKNSIKSAFESNVKLVLKTLDYKVAQNDTFDVASVNETNISSLLGINEENYSRVTFTLVDGSLYTIIIGQNKWDGLIACGFYTNMDVVENQSDCRTDLMPPIITLNGDSIININVGETYSDAGSSASDNIDGDITNQIVTSGTVNTTIPGTYTITYSVTDADGNTSTVTRTINVIETFSNPGYISNKGVNGPILAQGMTPVKWDGSAWVDTTASDTDWYNYTTTDKKWANVRTFDGSMWVWIPRYIYKISSGWHTSTVGTIDIQFSKGIDDNWNSSSIGDIDTGTTANTSNNKWTNHPAFTFGDTELTGIWVAKFEASNDGSSNVKIVPNVSSWISITVNNIFNTTRSMETNNIYGWGTTGNNIDTHMMKNTEWGAVVYLSKSIYGKNAEVWINNSSTFITGCAGNSVSAASYAGCAYAYNTANGQQSSTTGNIYGIYDMSGGTWEYTSSYVDNNHANLTNYGNSAYTADNKYKNVYTVAATDSDVNNYPLTISSKGDAIYETSNVDTGATAWYGDYSYMPYIDRPWFTRGGVYYYGSSAGIFNFDRVASRGGGGNSFRPVLLVNEGL